MQVIDLIDLFSYSILQKQEVYNKLKYSKNERQRVLHKVIHSQAKPHQAVYQEADGKIRFASHRS
jgi:hypothetical protein